MLSFKKITFGKVSALVETIAFHTINDIEHIERYYLNKATDFSNNLSFLSAIQLIEVLDGKILPSAIITALQSIQDKQEKSNKLNWLYWIRYFKIMIILKFKSSGTIAQGFHLTEIDFLTFQI